MSNFASHFKKLNENKKAAFLSVASDDHNWSSVQDRANAIFNSGFVKNKSQVLVIGIGGSSLGLRAFVDLVGNQEQQDRLIFLESPDPIQFQKILKKIKPNTQSLHVCAISKSGRTIETLSILSALIKELNSKNEILKTILTVVSDPTPSVLRDWAEKNNVNVVDMPAAVGGRYSVFTSVGLLPMALLGFDLQQIRSQVSTALEDKQILEQLFNFCSENINQKPIVIFWTYSLRLVSFGYWLQQLWAESLGKKNDLTGGKAKLASSPFVLIGPNDQHSVLQQVMEGQRDKFILFFEDQESENNTLYKVGTEFSGVEFLHGKSLGAILKTHRVATQKSLQDAGVLSETIAIKSANHGIQLFLQLMVLVSSLGYAMNVDPFDQPGVEAGKKLAKDLLSK